MTENRSVEVSGATIEEAIEAGLKMLQVSRESVIVEILEEPSRGFLGVGSKMALVRLTTAARPQTQPSPSRSETREAREPRETRQPRDHRQSREPREHRDYRESRRPSRPPRVSYDEQPAYEDFDDDNEEVAMLIPKTRKLTEEELTDDLRVGRDKLQELLQVMGLAEDTSIEVQVTDGNAEEDTSYILQVVGDDLRSLIGRRGDTLNALQYILRLIASRDLQRRADFVVDAGEYKASRARKLYQLANRMANQAVERQRVVKLEPMPAHERRIIHMALRQRGDVTTSSVGEGKFRKVTIIPKRD
jgi:spoIIIJ-associated protein